VLEISKGSGRMRRLSRCGKSFLLCFFHAMRSVFALENKDFSKHSGVAANFRKDFIKTGMFDIIFSDMIKSAFYVRNNSDYDDFYVISKADVEEQIQNAEEFCKAVKEYLQAQGIELNASEDSK